MNWNTLCRWAFCRSLIETHPPNTKGTEGESAVEMTWKTFGGDYAELYLALLKQRCHEDGFDQTEDILREQLRAHLQRGIGYLVGDPEIQSIDSLLRYLPIQEHTENTVQQ